MPGAFLAPPRVMWIGILAAAGLYLACGASAEWPQIAAAAMTALVTILLERRASSIGKLRFHRPPSPLLPEDGSPLGSLASSARLFAMRRNLPAAAHDIPVPRTPSRRALWTAWLSLLPDGYVVAVHARALRV
ncbi:MAG TPA: hypothetical protein VKH35_15305, partial [Thermoanaerobaculia bacterium]|nr:hypothetical protein [Thermoanaerobaculia bacterium]